MRPFSLLLADGSRLVLTESGKLRLREPGDDYAEAQCNDHDVRMLASQFEAVNHNLPH